MPTALITDPLARMVAASRPKTVSATYSAGPKDRAKRDSTGPATARATVATVPAKKDARAAVASAAPARPRLAMAWPSSAVTTAEASPGRLTRIAVVEPPYCAP